MSSLWIPAESEVALALRAPNLLTPADKHRGPLRINKSHPLARGLRHFVPFIPGQPITDLVSGSRRTNSGGSYVGDLYDLGASETVDFTQGDLYMGSTEPHSWAMLIETDQAASTNPGCWTIAQSLGSTALGPRCLLGSGVYGPMTVGMRDAIGATHYNYHWPTATFGTSITGLNFWGATNDGTSGSYAGVRVFKNELDAPADGGASLTFVTATSLGRSNATKFLDGRFRYFVVWSRQLTTSEMHEFRRNPFALLEPANQTPFLVSVSAGGGAVDLGAASAKHVHTADSAALSDARIPLGAASAKHAHKAVAAAIITTIEIGAASAKHTHKADAAALSNAKIQLGAASAKHVHNSDSAALVSGGIQLGAASAKHTNKADAASLSNAKIQLGSASAKHVHTADSATVVTASEIGAASAKHVHTANTAGLSNAKIQLGAASAKHAHKADASTFVVGFVLAAAAAKHIHKSDTAQVGRVKQDLAALFAKHVHKADAAGIATAAELGAASAKHTHTSGVAALTVKQVTLGAASVKHTHTAETAILSGIKQTMLSADANHAHTAEFVRFWSAVPALRPSPDRIFTPEVVVRRYEL